MSSAGSMLRLAVLGDGGVGKTALVVQLCLNKFVETYDPTIEDSYRKRILLDDHATTLEVMDTAGQEEYVSLRDQWIREGEGFLLVYSVTQRLSFTRIKQYYSEIKRIKDDEPFSIVLVGNKVDHAAGRVVTTQEGEQLSQQLGIPFYETSAKMNINTEVAFLDLARLTRDKNEFLDSGNGTVRSAQQLGQQPRQSALPIQTPQATQISQAEEVQPHRVSSEAQPLYYDSVQQSQSQEFTSPEAIDDKLQMPTSNSADRLGETNQIYKTQLQEPIQREASSKKKKEKKKCVIM